MIEDAVKKYVGRHSVIERGHPPFEEAVLNWLNDHVEVVKLLDDVLRCSAIIDKSGIVLQAHGKLKQQMTELAQLLEWGIRTWDKQPGTVRLAMELCCQTCHNLLEQQLGGWPNKEVLIKIIEQANVVTRSLVATTQDFPVVFDLDN